MNKLREAIGEDKEEIIKALTEDKAVAISFLFPMPNSWSHKKKREMYGTYHKQRPDIDNLCKWLTDSVFYQHERNDCEISQLRAIKVWDYEGKILIEIQ